MSAAAVVEVSTVNDEALLALRRLTPQLNPGARPLGAAELRKMIETPGTRLLFGKVDTVVAGMLTLLVFHTPTGTRSVIEDVVVDANWRRRGIGEALCRTAIGMAADMGAVTLDLTSNSSRVYAVHLYAKLGFKLRDTNPFRYVLRP